MTDKTVHPAFPEAFAALGVRPSILRALGEEKFITPTDIQTLLIPKALAGFDILGQARTGTGKTAAFGIPILQNCGRDGATQALVLVPTRELAVQVEIEIKRLAKYTPIRTVAVYGGQKIVAQMKFLRNNPQVVVGTPGRVIDLLDRRIINLNNVRFVVLDEVDRMLDIGFRDDIRNILSRAKRSSGARRQGTGGAGDDRADQADEAATASMADENVRPAADDAEMHEGEMGRSGDSEQESAASVDAGIQSQIANRKSQVSSVPQARGPEHCPQTMFVSATIAGEIEKLARTYMVEPVEKLIATGSDEKPTVAEVEQYYLPVQPWDKYRLLRMLLEKENPDLAIVFCRTKHGAEKLARKLHADGIECREIHGNLAQNKRNRVMKSFRGGKFDVLVATDLASRGIDVAGISHIINFDIPEDPEAYVHRVGRTARMGAAGKAFTLVTREQGDELTKVENLINMVIQPATVEGFKAQPTPSDWSEFPPGQGPAEPAKPVPSRFERTYSPVSQSGQSAGRL